jgi:hypothetical protein
MEPIEPLMDAGLAPAGTRRQVARPAAGLVALLAGLGAGLATGRPAHAAAPYDWRVVRNGLEGRQLGDGAGCRLVNVTAGDVLAYGVREEGINLVWQNVDGQENVRFYKVGGGVIRYGDRVALYVQGGAYVKYGEREQGINLVWSSTRVYDWEFVGGTPGAPVVTGTPYFHGLRNTTVQQFVVYGERRNGINLVWYG